MDNSMMEDKMSFYNIGDRVGQREIAIAAIEMLEDQKQSKYAEITKIKKKRYLFITMKTIKMNKIIYMLI